VETNRQRSFDSIHGCSDHLSPSHLCLGGGPGPAAIGVEPCGGQVALDGFRFRGASGEHAGALEGDQWAHSAGTLRHDGDRHGLSNPLHGKRVPGSVGIPLPGVQVRLCGQDGEPVAEGIPGEIEVRGPSVFSEYWGKPEATREAFREGWFRTGDTAVAENCVYRILGRTSIDILKTGGHKVSALEIEEVLLQHPGIAECAVVGVADEEWGQRVAAAVVLRAGAALSLDSLRAWARELLAGHELPSRLLVLEALPRNAMGKVMKPAVTNLFSETTTQMRS